MASSWQSQVSGGFVCILFVFVVSSQISFSVTMEEFRTAAWRNENDNNLLVEEFLQYRTCESSMKPLLLSSFHSSLDEGYIRNHLQLLCRLFSFPKIRDILGSNFNPAWYPTFGKLVKSIIEGTLNAPIFQSADGIRQVLRAYLDDIQLNGPGETRVNLSNIAAPVGILPPDTPKENPLQDLTNLVSKFETDPHYAQNLKALFRSGNLHRNLTDRFDASYYTTYGDLISGIALHMHPNDVNWEAMYSLTGKVDETDLDQTKFNPQLIHDLNLPPVSEQHNSFIKEIVYTTIDSEYHIQARSLEEFLNDGRIIVEIGSTEIETHQTKGELLKSIINQYIKSLSKNIDPYHDIRNAQIRFLEDKVQLDKSGAEAVDPELFEVLRSVENTELMRRCINAIKPLGNLYPFVPKTETCKTLNYFKRTGIPLNSQLIGSIINGKTEIK